MKLLCWFGIHREKLMDCDYKIEGGVLRVAVVRGCPCKHIYNIKIEHANLGQPMNIVEENHEMLH